MAVLIVLVVSAIGAGSAFAAGPKYTTNTYAQYKYCPYENPEVQFCYTGITQGGAKGGFFEVGKVKVKLSKPITLQGGYREGVENEEELEVYPAAQGGVTLDAPELKVTGGIGLFNKRVQENREWPTALRESWKEAKKNHEGNVYAKIEMAGNELFEVPGGLSTTNLLFEEGTVFRLPLKVKLTSPWLEKLGSGPCYVGSDENPIHINLTSGGSGNAGQLEHDEGFNQVILRDSKLVDVGWKIDEASKVEGCGGAYESYIDNSLNEVLEVAPWKSGIVVLQGTLYTAKKNSVKEKGAEKGEL